MRYMELKIEARFKSVTLEKTRDSQCLKDIQEKLSSNTQYLDCGLIEAKIKLL